MNKFANICVGIGTISLALSITLLITSEAALNYHRAMAAEAMKEKERLESKKLDLEIQEILKGVR